MAYDSVTTWRLYSAEQSVPLGEPLPDVHAARALVRKVKRSAWWHNNVEESPRIDTRIGGGEAAGHIWSYAHAHERFRPQRWTISMHPAMLNDLVVLHEIAHCIAPRWWYSDQRRRKDEVPAHRSWPAHGAGYAGAMAELVREFGEGARHDDLRAAYHHYEVPVMTLEEYREAIPGSLRAEDDLIDIQRQSERLVAETPSLASGTVPRWWWGETLWLMRRQVGHEQGKLSQEALAQTISQVERCTRRDISRIEHSEVMPEDPRLRRIAMCFAVALGLDPIYARHQVGLVRWNCGVELDELRVINPGWVELVEDMNRKLEERPPCWVVEGER